MYDLDLTIPEPYRDCLRLGTCSWKYDSWKDLIYRPGVDYSPDDYLPDYARFFNTVEVDQWFWSLFPPGVKLPDEPTVEAYAAGVPDDFLFTVKAPNALTLTHYYSRQPKRYQAYANRPNEHFLSVELLQRFLDALRPMGSKLGPVMLQFEYLNRQKMPSLGAFLEKLHAFFADAPDGFGYAIETRNKNYLRPEFFDFLRDHCLGYVFLEGYYMPPIGQVAAENDTRTADFAVIRLHGGGREEMEERTGKKWGRIVEEKPEGIAAAVEIVRSNARERMRAIVNINNHYEGCAPLTAQRFLEVLRG
jgi:uncharacterized protein YecE (DUF72 family)